ncbi:putative disease resistance RPP13-like protein 1 isoform X2 [Jatropha curcas]|uniref:putative disease resistance RPP13-like protein 1 isoform X2 n=1 Tax=Jatropha curcas TaxID=180498 RepID=UPI0018952333|nr:putative disease resistance RPP13-like protein 1 isoform X2 [Jatropha curcas]
MGKTISVDESSVYGRNDDKEAIIENLLSADENGLEVISIIAAKFDIFKIAKDILEEVSAKSCDFKSPIPNREILPALKGRLMGKKFLLVLDDVWNDNEFEWSFLLDHLESAGAGGSKIIITTRNQSVVLALGSSQSHFLGQLNDDDCWSLFAKHAFYDDCSCNENYLGLEIIGREIVKKCQGLPLIAKMLGDLLCSERNVEVWQRISNNMEVRSHYNICMILKLSHVDLLFHLRQCLAFGIKCPKDYTLVKEKLVLSWIQENLVRFNKTVEKEEVDNNFFFTNLESRDNIIHDIAISSVSENFLQCSISQIYIEAILEWAITGIYLVLEILLVTLEQIGSPKRPRCAFYALVVSFVALFICIVEIVCKGQKQNIDLRRQGIGYWLRFPSSNHNPYTYIDIFSLVSAISQVIFSCIAYSYLRRGAQNPIKMCFVPVIFTFCMASSRLVRKPNETKLPITSD